MLRCLFVIILVMVMTTGIKAQSEWLPIEEGKLYIDYDIYFVSEGVARIWLKVMSDKQEKEQVISSIHEARRQGKMPHISDQDFNNLIRIEKEEYYRLWLYEMDCVKKEYRIVSHLTFNQEGQVLKDTSQWALSSIGYYKWKVIIPNTSKDLLHRIACQHAKKKTQEEGR